MDEDLAWVEDEVIDLRSSILKERPETMAASSRSFLADCLAARCGGLGSKTCSVQPEDVPYRAQLTIEAFDPKINASHQPKTLTENAAYAAMALFFCCSLPDCKLVAFHDATGADFELVSPKGVTYYVEASGIARGDHSEIAARVREKHEQIKTAPDGPGFVFVMEFGRLILHLSRKN